MLNKLTIVIIYSYEICSKVTQGENMPDRKLEIKFIEGGPMILPTDPPVALCRCGYSENKPYCDGQHAQLEANIFTSNEWLPEFTIFIPLATIKIQGE
jgi:CDGSH-type Zn-finger protein